MNNKPFEQWWAGLRDVGEKKLIKSIDLEEGRSIHVNEPEARELHAQIIEAADYAMPCTIMRRFAQMDDSPLGCYVPVAYCDHYGQFEELIEAAGKPHALICIQRQEERRKPKAEPETEPESQGANVARAMVLAQDVEELTKERDELAKKLEEYGTEIAHLRGQQLDEGQRQLIIMGLADCVLNCQGFEHACREVAEHLNGVVMFDHFKVTRARYKTPPPSGETAPAPDPS